MFNTQVRVGPGRRDFEVGAQRQVSVTLDKGIEVSMAISLVQSMT